MERFNPITDLQPIDPFNSPNTEISDEVESLRLRLEVTKKETKNIIRIIKDKNDLLNSDLKKLKNLNRRLNITIPRIPAMPGEAGVRFGEEVEQEKRRKENAKKGKAEWDKLHPELCGGSLGRTPEQHSADSARAAQKGIVQWTKDKWENDPEWAANKREMSRQTALKNIELGIGIAALTKEQRSANTKALYEGENGEYHRQRSIKLGKDNYAK